MREWLIIRLHEIKSKCKAETAGGKEAQRRSAVFFQLSLNSYKYDALLQHSINTINWLHTRGNCAQTRLSRTHL